MKLFNGIPCNEHLRVYFKVGDKFIPIDEPATLEQLKAKNRAICALSGEKTAKAFDAVWNRALPTIKAELWDLSHAEEK